MVSEATTPDAYVNALPADRRAAMQELRRLLKKNLPKGYEETMSYGMIGYVVPHKTYPEGYHCDPKLPLPFVSIASQKNFIALYHMGLYAMPDLMKWFKAQWPKEAATKLDMGKSCIRFKKPGDIPFKLIGELAKKVAVTQWIDIYEKNFRKSKIGKKN